MADNRFPKERMFAVLNKLNIIEVSPRSDPKILRVYCTNTCFSVVRAFCNISWCRHYLSKVYYSS